MPAGPCSEADARKKLKTPPAVMKAFTNEMLDGLRNGMSYPETLKDLADRSGLQEETINDMFKRDPQTFRISKVALARESELRRLRDAADDFAGQLKANGKMYVEPGFLAKAWESQRVLKLAGHSPIFPWSHMRNLALQIPTRGGRQRMAAFWRSAIDVYRYPPTEKGRAMYALDSAFHTTAPRHEFWASVGLDNQLGKRTPGDILMQRTKPKWSGRNFDTLKMARQNMAEGIYNDADPTMRDADMNEAFSSIVARDLNYSTGTVMEPRYLAKTPLSNFAAASSRFAGESRMLLASKLFFAKHMDAWTPLRYISKLGRRTPAERAAGNVAISRWANTVATHFAILGANYAFNKMMGYRTPNLFDPSQSDFWRLRFGNTVVPFSPLLEATRLPIVFTATMLSKRNDEAAGEVAWRALWNAAHPAVHLIYEQATGKEGVGGRPLKYSLRGVYDHYFPKPQSRTSHKSNLPEVSGTEYATTRISPIALSAGVHEFYQALRDNGFSPNIAMAFVKSAIAAGASAFIGTHMYEEVPRGKKKTTASAGGYYIPGR